MITYFGTHVSVAVNFLGVKLIVGSTAEPDPTLTFFIVALRLWERNELDTSFHPLRISIIRVAKTVTASFHHCE